MELTTDQKRWVIAITVLLGCAIVAMALLTNHWFLSSLPATPSLTTGGGRTVDSVKAEIENYKAVASVIKDNQSYLNDLLVVKFLKPLFDALLVAIIAYLFGKPVIAAVTARIIRSRQ